MNEPTQRPADPSDSTADEFDAEGHAFSWKVVDDPKHGRHLRQEWTPDGPSDPRSTRTEGTTQKKPGSPR